MSLKKANRVRTICEVLREINDVLQNSEIQKKILPKLIEAETMAKKMEKKLIYYNKAGFPEWWGENPDYEKDLARRMNKRYVV